MEKCRLDVRRYTFLTLTVRGDWSVWRLCCLSLGKQPWYPLEIILCGPSSLSGLLSQEITYAAESRSVSRRAWKERPSPFVNISQHVGRFTPVHFPTLNWKMTHCWLSATAYSTPSVSPEASMAQTVYLLRYGLDDPGSNPVRCKRFVSSPKPPHRHWGSLTFLVNMYQSSFWV